MPDREKVIKGLECCTNSDMNMCLYNCPYHKDHTDGCSGGIKMMRDALALLKEQETVVLCKDCKHYDTITGICGKGNTHGYADTWSCADGKRR